MTGFMFAFWRYFSTSFHVSSFQQGINGAVSLHVNNGHRESKQVKNKSHLQEASEAYGIALCVLQFPNSLSHVEKNKSRLMACVRWPASSQSLLPVAVQTVRSKFFSRLPALSKRKQASAGPRCCADNGGEEKCLPLADFDT